MRVNVPAAATQASYVTGASEAGLTSELVLGTDVIIAGVAASRPAAGTAGRLYFSTDTFVLERDTGAAWVKVGASAHGGLDSVTASQHHTAFVQADHDALANPHHSNANDHAASHTHVSHTGIGADDHHAQTHTHASHTGIGATDHHSNANDHAQSHTHASHTSIGASDHHNRTEAKITSGAAESETVTWTTAFATAPAVSLAIKDVASNPQPIPMVTSTSTTTAVVTEFSSTGTGPGADVKHVIGMETT